MWLRRHRRFVVALTAASILAALILDIVIPGYAIAGFYLFPVMLVAFTLRERLAIAVSALCLALTVSVMVLQGRSNGQNILLIVFGVLGGAGLIALADLFNRVDELYESERSTTVRLQYMTARLEALQEVLVAVNKLVTPQAILDRVVRSGAELLNAGCVVVTRDGLTSRTHAMCSPYAEGGEESPAPVDEALLLQSIGDGAGGTQDRAAIGGRVHRVSLDARLLGADDPGAEAAMVFVRRPDEPEFDREDETLAATLAALLTAGLDRTTAQV